MSKLEVGLIAQGDWVVDEVVRAVGEMFEPVALLLDQYDSMLNPTLAPDEMVRWLSRCLGLPVEFDATRGERRLLAAVPQLYRSWATSNGVRLLVSCYLDVAENGVEIVESGAADWSDVAGGGMPGSSDPFVEVRIARSLEEDELKTLRSLLTFALPVGMPCRILSN